MIDLDHRKILARLGKPKDRPNKFWLIFKECPFCGHAKWKFNVNFRVERFHCFRCKEGGGLDRLYTTLYNRSPEGGPRRRPATSPTSPGKRTQEKRPSDLGGLSLPSRYRRVVDCLDSVMGSTAREYLKLRHVHSGRIRNYGVSWEHPLRVIIPIISDGKVRSWVARSCFPWVEPKEMHPPAAREGIFNIDEIKEGVEDLVIVEGIFDCEKVWYLHRDVVALMGTAMSSSKAGLILSKRPKKIHLFPDGDAGGAALLSTSMRSLLPRLPYSTEVRVALCPREKDPAELDTLTLMDTIKESITVPAAAAVYRDRGWIKKRPPTRRRPRA